MIEISIVIPTYRRPELLPRAIASCLAQQGDAQADARGDAISFEIVVVDNDETGSARPIVEPIAAASAVPIRYVVEPRPGISHARNAGVANAAGRYVAFLDDDEAAEPGWLAALLSTIRRCAADAAVGPVYPCLPATDAYCRKVYTRDARVATGTRLSYWSKLNGLFDKERCFGATPEPFDPRLGLSGGEDTLFLRQLMRCGRKIVWCAEALAREAIPLERLAPRYLLLRRFHAGQLTTYVRTAVRPPQPGRAVFWMAVGCAQLMLYAPAALVLRAVNHKRWLSVAAKAVGGLGKILWHPKLYFRLYR